MSLFSDILKGLPENAVLRDKVREAEADQAKLETENAILKDDLRSAKAEITKLKNQIEKVAHVELDKTHVEILKMLSDNRIQPYAIVFSIALGLNEQRIEYHLEQLIDLGYIHRNFGLDTPDWYELLQKGREYLIQNGLL